MKWITIGLLLVSTSAEAHDGLFVPKVTLAITATLDNVTTNIGLARNPNGRELNPLLSSYPPVNAIQQGFTLAATEIVISKYGPKHPKLAKIICYGISGFSVAGTLNTLTNKVH